MVGDNQWVNNAFLTNICSLQNKLDSKGRIVYNYEVDEYSVATIYLNSYAFDVKITLKDAGTFEEQLMLSCKLPREILRMVSAYKIFVEEQYNKGKIQ